jgi:rubrerythrin
MNPQTEISRRRLFQGLGLATVAGAPVFLAACGGDDTSTSSSSDEVSDLKIVQAAQAMELAMVAGYTKVVSLLDPKARPLGQQILTQEQAHATGLGTVVGDLGGKPVAPKSDAEYEQALGLAVLKNQADALKFADDLENAAIFAYVDAVARLTNGDLRGTFCSLATDEAEHTAVVIGLQTGNDPARQSPQAFVTGTKGAYTL